MTELEQAINCIEGLRRGTCWCEMSIGNPNYRTHTGVCQSAVILLESHGRYVPKEAKE